MADYLTQFSCLLDTGSAANRAEAETIRDELEAELDRLDESLGFDMAPSPENGPGVLWLHAWEAGEPAHVIAFALRCAAALGLTGRWGFRFAETCSRPRLDGFGGGAHVLDLGAGEVLASISLATWLDDALATKASAATGRGGR